MSDTPSFAAHRVQVTAYSLDWARTVVKRLVGKYPRATETVRRFSGIDEELMAKVLARRPIEWQHLRDIVKAMGHQEELHPEHAWTRHGYYTFVKCYYKNRQGSMPLGLYLYLTRDQSEIDT